MPQYSHVTIVDYGLGNLFSVRRAFECVGASPHMASKPEEILNAERLVLPGVGAFADGMAGLQKYGFVEPLKEYAKLGRPFLGICVGMQMMLSRGFEFGEHPGLDLIAGDVRRIPEKTTYGLPVKVPHIGWSALHPAESPDAWKGTFLQNTLENQAVYFVHSYAAVPTHQSNNLAVVSHGNHRITAAVSQGHLMGCQFHPERSGPVGLKMIESFLNL